MGARYGKRLRFAWLGEWLGTGLIGSLLSYPLMVWFTGTKTDLYWFVYTPRFMGATVIGGFMAWLIWSRLRKLPLTRKIQAYFGQSEVGK